MPRIAFAHLVLFAAALAPAAARPAAACPSCKEAVAAAPASPDEPPAPDLAAGYDASILLMFGMPFVLLAGLGVMMLRAQPTARPERTV